jgi:[ribosomal protein S5]-alanine N-acetyltransferase
MSAPTVHIVQLSPEALAALAEGDVETATALSGVRLSPWQVSERELHTWQRRATQVVDTPADLGWVTGVILDDETGAAVGKAGFHEAPDAEGLVEVGYAVDPAYRRQGYARAALAALLERASAEPAVTTVRASVAPDNEPSRRLVLTAGFVEVGEQWDEEDGLELVYERPA